MKQFVLSAFADEAGSGIEEQISALERNQISMIEIRNIDGTCVIDLEHEELRRLLRRSEKFPLKKTSKRTENDLRKQWKRQSCSEQLASVFSAFSSRRVRMPKRIPIPS